MITLRTEWDAPTYAQFWNFANYGNYMKRFLDDIAESFGAEGVKFIKPHVKGNGKWHPPTGATERSIGYETTRTNDGVSVQFTSTNIASNGRTNTAHYVDVGNFPASSQIFRTAQRPFPVGKRAGDVPRFFMAIHGMGHSDPSYPRNFSEKGLDHLYNNVPSLADKAFDDFLDRLVNV